MDKASFIASDMFLINSMHVQYMNQIIHELMNGQSPTHSLSFGHNKHHTGVMHELTQV